MENEDKQDQYSDLSIDDAAAAMGFSTTLSDTMLQPMLDAENMPVEDEASPTGEEVTEAPQEPEMPLEQEEVVEDEEVPEETEAVDPDEFKGEVKDEVKKEVKGDMDDLRKEFKDEMKGFKGEIKKMIENALR